MNSSQLISLYTKSDLDEEITPYNKEVGFSLVRNYPENTLFNRDGMKMFIKIALLESGLFWSISMVKPEFENEQKSYLIYEGDKYKNQAKFTNFWSDNKEPFYFDSNVNKIVYQPSNKTFTLNEFIDLLVKNHLRDRLYLKRKINSFVNLSLKALFWLSDKHYDKVNTSIDKYHFSRNNQPVTEESKNIEPFFKYFFISRNLIFSKLVLLLLATVIFITCPSISAFLKTWKIGDFSLSNPIITLLIFILLFIAEKLSIWLNQKIKEFFSKNDYNKKINFIEKLHNYQLNDSFNLKINL